MHSARNSLYAAAQSGRIAAQSGLFQSFIQNKAETRLSIYDSLFIYLFIHVLIYSFLYILNFISNHLSICFYQWNNSYNHTSIHSTIHSCTHSFIRSFICHTFIHLSFIHLDTGENVTIGNRRRQSGVSSEIYQSIASPTKSTMNFSSDQFDHRRSMTINSSGDYHKIDEDKMDKTSNNDLLFVTKAEHTCIQHCYSKEKKKW